MTTIAPGLDTLNSAAVRAAGYSLLAYCFAYPGEDAGLSLKQAADESRPFLDGTPLEHLPDVVAGLDLDGLERAHVALFTLTAAPDCPKYETAFLDGDLVGQTRRMATIAGLYRMFGVEVSTSGTRPDDISAELEFLSFLNCKEMYADAKLGSRRVAEARKAQRLFLVEHVGCWAAALADCVERSTQATPFYRDVALSLREWVEADMARLGAVPATRAAEPIIRLDPMPVSHGPELSSDGPLIPLDAIQ